MIELDEDTAARLEELAASSGRYQDAASEVVRLYTELLEDVEAHMTAFKTRQRGRERGRIQTAPRARKNGRPLPAEVAARAAGSA